MSVVIVLAILGGLAAVAAAALSAETSGTSVVLRGLPPTGGIEDGGTTTTARPRSLPDAAAGGSCLANARVVEQAAAAKHAVDGAFPSSVAELVAGRWLDEAPSLHGYELTLQAVAGRPTGTVLVNGLPAAQGCTAPARPGP